MVDTSGKPGVITNISEEGIVVAVSEGGILVQRVRPHDAGKIPASEFVESSGLSTGYKFGK
jgi:methionyl-tRNA formyltransferase